MKPLRSSINTLLLVVVIAFAVACGDDDNDTAEEPAADGVTADGSVEVDMKEISFAPEEVTVKVDTTVRWVNSDPVAHTVTDDQGLFDSGVLDSDDVFEHMYDQPGTYEYTCTLHPTTMKGTVVVEE